MVMLSPTRRRTMADASNRFMPRLIDDSPTEGLISSSRTKSSSVEENNATGDGRECTDEGEVLEASDERVDREGIDAVLLGTVAATMEAEAVDVGDSVGLADGLLSGFFGAWFRLPLALDWKLDESCLWALLSMPWTVGDGAAEERIERNRSDMASARRSKPVITLAGVFRGILNC